MSNPYWQPVFVGVGSNLDDPLEHVTQALAQLDDVKHTQLVLCSELYLTDPVGPEGQPDYVNAVAGLLTQLAPPEMLDSLQAIEQEHGRAREGPRWSPRTLDLDLLAFGDCIINSDRLTVPHPQLHLRDFVLGPWMDIAPEFKIVGQGSVRRLAQCVDLGTLRRINSLPVPSDTGAAGIP